MAAATYLTFSPSRARKLAATMPIRGAVTWRDLAARASGVHATLEEAIEYAQAEGPMVVLSPTGDQRWIERRRDAAADARIAAEERAFAEQLRRLTWREARPNFSA